MAIGPESCSAQEDEEQSGLDVTSGEAIGVTFLVPFKQSVGLHFRQVAAELAGALLLPGSAESPESALWIQPQPGGLAPTSGLESGDPFHGPRLPTAADKTDGNG